MTRRQARENAFAAVFAATFGEPVDYLVEVGRQEQEPFAVDAFGEEIIGLYQAHADAVDSEIEKRLKGWKVKRLPRVSLAILRISVAEMLYGAADMDSVIINEAVEMAKKYGDEQDYQFINGVLGNISRDKAPAAEAGQPPLPSEGAAE